MRKTTLVGMALLFSLASNVVGQTPAAKAATLYRQGLQAMEQGQAETARTCFQEVLRLQPNNANAKFQLKQLTLQAGSMAAKKRQTQMKEIRLPAIDFDELTLPEALDALDEMVLKQTEKKFAPNFVVQDPENVFGNRKFSLKLGNLPASVVLQYCLENARASARYDSHAIVVRPLGTARKAAAESER